MNKSDSEKMLGLLENENYTETDDISNANLIILNSCSVRKHAVDRLDAHISDLKKIKRQRPSLIIAVGGCVAQHEKEKLQQKFPFIDIIFGTFNFHLLPQLIKEIQKNRHPLVSTLDEPLAYDTIKSKRVSKFHSWITIITGCSNYCTYCIVPYVRGTEISRPVQSILHETEEVVQDGAVAVTLLGQNVDAYGKDLSSKSSLSELLKKLHDIQNLKCIRFVTSHPKDMTEELITTVAELPKVGNFFHLPLQSGDNAILKLMNRKYNLDDYAKLIDGIKSKMPFVSITSDLIVGFPSETEEQFLNSVEAVKRFEFDSVNTAAYSPRPYTAAAKMKDQVPSKEKQARLIYLNQIVKEMAYKQNQKFIGQDLEVIVESYSKKKQTFQSRTFSNKIVHFAPPLLSEESPSPARGEGGVRWEIGKIIKLHVIKAGAYSLLGEFTAHDGGVRLL